jgi:nicotinate-nucleotide adenylyltransferase
VTLAIMGGTFDPVHIGHLILAQEVRAELGYDTVLFVPSSLPAHKRPPEASSDDRLAMLRAAVDGVSGFAVDDCELRRGGVSYTIDTVAHVAGAYRLDRRPGLVVGDDLVAGFAAWREPEAVAGASEIVLAHRERAEELPFPYPHVYCHNPLVAVSSSSVRERVRRGLPIRFLVPDAVARHIEARGLYR